VDCVFVAESSESFRAAGREQFYVSTSRFKENLTIYTDDKHQLLEAVRKSSHRPSATDLVSKENAEPVCGTEAKNPVLLNADADEQRKLNKKIKMVCMHKPVIRKKTFNGLSI